MKKGILLMVVLILALALSGCCRHHRKGPCGIEPHGPCAAVKPCAEKMGNTCQKPCCH